MSELGTLSTSESRLWQIISEATAGRYDKYSELYMKASDDVMVTIANTPNEKSVSYCTFQGGFDVEGADEVEAVFDIADLADYFDFVSGNGNVEVTFHGEEGERIPSHYTISSELEATVYSKHNEEDLKENFSLGAPQIYNDDEHYSGSTGPLDTVVRGDADTIQRIARAVDDEKLDLVMHPFVVEDGDLRLEASDDQNRNSISGELSVNSVEGPDVENYYDEQFEAVFTHLSGEVEVQTEQDSVLSVVKEDGSDVYRHIIAPA